ncbi:MAG TPA: type II secretion system protein GspC [Steroidobacteraceae bacterium]|nr:type II secretion system protein GspC [Steroidobacteraceae bacterium]
MASATIWIDDLKSVQGLTRLFVDRGAQLVVLVLLLALGLDSALILTRALGHGPDLPPPAVGSAPVLPRVNVNPTLQLASIVNAHLFGAGAVAAGGSDAPATSMPLILAGVIADPDPGKGVAIIGENAAAGKLYAVGAAIPGGVHLHAVYSDRVLLERNGGLETLMLPRTPMSGRAAAPAIASSPRAGNSQSTTVLAGLVRVQPVFNQGKLQGYRIFPGGAHGTTAFTQLGLKPGDLIEAVNGTALDDAARAMEVLQTLSSSATATVTVSRNGAPQEVNLNLANLNLDADSGDNTAGGQTAAASPDQGSTPPAGAPNRGRMASPPNLSTAPGAPTGSVGTINAAAPGTDAPVAPVAPTGGDHDR